MNIKYYYRKCIEKSRSFIARYIAIARIDIFLFIAALVVLAIAASTQLFRQANTSKRTIITISRQCENLLGRVILGDLIQDFEELNPELQIQVEADNNADIVFFDDSEIKRLIASASLTSLEPYIHSEAQTEQWAVPLVSFMDLFFYNIDILEAANLDRPPKTRTEFLAAARTIAAQKTAFPLALGLSESDPLALRRDFYPWIWATGNDLRSPGREDLTLSRSANDTIAFFAQLNKEGLLAPNSFEKNGVERLLEFADGKIAMISASSRNITLLQRGAHNINFGISTMPQTAQGQNRLGLSWIYAGISSDCTLPDEAWSFLAFVAGRKQLLEEALCAVPGGFPNAFPGNYITTDPLLSKAWEIFEAVDIVEYFSADPLEEETDRIIREKLAEAF